MSTEAASGCSIARREDALDFMAQWPSYGEQRWYSDAARNRAGLLQLAAHAAANRCRGSYGHRHPGQEEVYFVISGTVTVKVGDDVFKGGPQTVVRTSCSSFRRGSTTRRSRRWTISGRGALWSRRRSVAVAAL
jgi:hypothetical protein